MNVLVAPAWPNHEHHQRAVDWFTTESASEWATTAITEAGLVRISSNRAALGTATTPQNAVGLFDRLTARSGHAFWDDTVQRVTGDTGLIDRITGYRQVTHAHLVALSVAHGGHLVTFDQAVAQLQHADTGSVRVLAPRFGLGDC